MSQFYEYNWPAADSQGVSLLQKVNKNSPLLLDGFYANKITRTVNFVTDFGIVPKITLTADGDLSGINFLITGYQNGVFISETLTGPNSATVTSVNCFDSVAQIIPDNDAGVKVQVGVGPDGYFPMILLNTTLINTSSVNYALNFVITPQDSAVYQVFLSLKNNLGLGKYDDLTSAANGNFVNITIQLTSNPELSESKLINTSYLGRNLLIKVITSSTDELPPRNILKYQFLQL